MTPLETAEQIVEQMSPSELARFRQWFAEFDNKAWDEQIEADVAAGKLDALAEEALVEYRAGKEFKTDFKHKNMGSDSTLSSTGPEFRSRL